MPTFFRLSKESYINLDNITEVQFTARNVTFIHSGGHVKASVTSEEFTAGVKAWLIKNGIDVLAVETEEPEKPAVIARLAIQGQPNALRNPNTSAKSAAEQPQPAPTASTPDPTPKRQDEEDIDSGAVDFQMNE